MIILVEAIIITKREIMYLSTVNPRANANLIHQKPTKNIDAAWPLGNDKD